MLDGEMDDGGWMDSFWYDSTDSNLGFSVKTTSSGP